MVDPITGLGAVKAAFDLAKSLKNINDATVRNGAVIELQEKILSAQETQTALVQRVSELEAKVAEFEAWEAQKKRYALKDFGGDTFAYELKATEANGEPFHSACPNCYQNRHISILQGRGEDAFKREMFVCHKCKADFHFGQKMQRNLQTSSYNPRRAP